jgi:hypothetical protein
MWQRWDAITESYRRTGVRIGILMVTCLVVLSGCGSTAPGTVDAPRDGNPTTTATTASSTTVATTPTSRAPVTASCRGTQWAFDIPAGWQANVQPSGSRTPSCIALVPDAVVPRFTVVDGHLTFPEPSPAEMSGPWIGISLSSRNSIESLVAESVRNSGSNAKVTIGASAVTVDGAAPNVSMWRIVPVGAPTDDVRVRVRYTLADSSGYAQKGSVIEALLVATRDRGTVMATINSGDLLGSPPPGVSMDDAAAALDQLAQSLRLV